MKTSSLLLGTILACAPLGNALDLTPQPGFRMLEDMKIPVVIFDDAPRTVQWQAPGKWNLSGGGNLLRLRPSESPNAGMELRIIPRNSASSPVPATDRDAAESWVRSFMPVGASKISFAREMPSPFLLGGKPSRELTFNYSYQAREFTTSIALTDLDDAHSLAVIIYAPTEAFAAIHTEGTQSMFRWSWLSSPSATQAGGGNRGAGTASSDYVPAK